ncbi:hypothetical protein [Lentibacillus salinarum]|uniref:N-acetyltransferase domain-containing protein n=1 Tax=Lentibacillus salinarum TaxID=446820 RepID=A0ABW3ZST0_9BACI
MGAMDRLPIYAKVKIVEGAHFVTIEDTKQLAENEMREFVWYFMEDLALTDVSSINLLVNSQFSEKVDRLLEARGFQLYDHVVMVGRELDDLPDTGASPFIRRSLNELPLATFTRIWQEATAASPNAPSVMPIDGQMENVRKELGAGYRATCQVAYDGGIPIGVVMPHIEPGTRDEGRLFYFGLIPEARGKGKSKPLHMLALQTLKEEFAASYYIGSTSEKNIPMLQTFASNGCSVMERNRVYTRKK